MLPLASTRDVPSQLTGMIKSRVGQEEIEQNQDNKSRCTLKRLALGRSCFTQWKCRALFAGLRTAIARCVSSSRYIVITAASIASETHHSAES